MISSKEDVETMIVTFRKEQRMGRQTKYLTIDLDMLSNQMYSQLPTIFPNIVQLITVKEEGEKREEAALNKFIKWKDTLTVLSDEESPLHTFCLLEKNVYSNLFELDISTLAFKGVMSHSSHINILKCIQNAPKLGILTISDCKITLAFLENVHNSCARLYDFVIYGSLISTVNEVLPEYIIPAARMVKFKVTDTLILDGSCLFVRYLSHKYTGLSTLRISPTTVHSGFQSFFLIEEGI
jgi:hypothetical protein